jgi:hypothetical protein
MGLKRRLCGIPALRRKARKRTFVELTAPPALPLAEYASILNARELPTPPRTNVIQITGIIN